MIIPSSQRSCKLAQRRGIVALLFSGCSLPWHQPARDGLCVCVCSRQGTTGKRPGKARVIRSQGSTAVKGVTTVMEDTCCQMLKGMPSSPKRTNAHKHSPNIFWSYMLPCRSASTLVGSPVSRKKPAAGCNAIGCLLLLMENWWVLFFCHHSQQFSLTPYRVSSILVYLQIVLDDAFSLSKLGGSCFCAPFCWKS